MNSIRSESHLPIQQRTCEKKIAYKFTATILCSRTREVHTFLYIFPRGSYLRSVIRQYLFQGEAEGHEGHRNRGGKADVHVDGKRQLQPRKEKRRG